MGCSSKFFDLFSAKPSSFVSSFYFFVFMLYHHFFTQFSYVELFWQVFDCWFESGSMPYAYIHYPFENVELFEKNFPGHFVAEGLDQTRGWFVPYF